jgi:hypothetical protein
MSYVRVGRADVRSQPMELLKDPPSGYDGIAKAFEMARHLPTTHRLNVQIGLVHDGVLFARGHLDGHRQVSFFSEHVRELGWREHLLGGDDDMHGCDMLFSHPASSVPPEDPSFIRRPSIELWPGLTSHVDPQS